MSAQRLTLSVLFLSCIFGVWFIFTQKSHPKATTLPTIETRSSRGEMQDMNSDVAVKTSSHLEGGEVRHGLRITDVGYMVYDPGNFAFQIPGDWVPISGLQLLPVGYEKPRFLLKKQGTPCVIGYFDQEFPGLDVYAQTGFAQRVFSMNGTLQFDTQWYAPQEVLPEDFSFSTNSIQPAPGEIYSFGGSFNVPTYTKSPNLILFNELGGKVHEVNEQGITYTPQCVDDMLISLQTWETYFQNTTLQDTSQGYIFVNRSDQGQSEPNPQLYFKSTQDDELTYTLGPSHTPWGSDTVLRGSILESIDAQNNLVSYLVGENAFLGDIKIPVRGVIIDRYGYKNREWLLTVNAGALRDEWSGPVTLHEWSREGNTVTTLGTFQLRYPSIYGYDPIKKQLILESGFGDAGMRSYEYFAFDEVEKAVKEVGKYVTDAYEVETPSEREKIQEIQFYIEGAVQRKRASYVVVKTHGVLSLGVIDLPELHAYGRFSQFVE